MNGHQKLIKRFKLLREKTDLGRLATLYPDEGPLRRELYVKYVNMLQRGAVDDLRVMMGGNRTGKSFGVGAYETALHATGLYPHWWEGHRFREPILLWACGTKSIKTRDVNQHILIGELKRNGSENYVTGGHIAPRFVLRATRKSGVPDAADRVEIAHVGGWTNVIAFKSYEEGRKAFEAEAVHWVWLDEECPPEVLDECKMRTLTTHGHMMVTLTPVEGWSTTVVRLLDGVEFK